MNIAKYKLKFFISHKKTLLLPCAKKREHKKFTFCFLIFTFYKLPFWHENERTFN